MEINKLVSIPIIALSLGAGTVLLVPEKEPVELTKPVLDSKIDSAIITEQAKAISQKGTYEQKVIEGEDGVKREVIPYVSPDGRKGYTVIYEKKEILTDKKGSTTEKVYRQQIDYGHEGRTTLW